MIILEEIVDYFLEKQMGLKEISVMLNSAGIINTYYEDENRIKVEVPTIRPDLNCVFGVLLEIAALTNARFRKEIFSDKQERLDECGIESDIPVFVAKIDREQMLGDMPLSIHKMLVWNQFDVEDTFQKFIYFCALFFGIPPMVIPKRLLGETVTVKDYTIYGKGVWKWGEKSADYGEEELCLFFLLSKPAEMKSYFKQKGKKADALYYYYIRRGNCTFISTLLRFLNLQEQFYGCHESQVNIYYKHEWIEKILGESVDKEEALRILKQFGYRIEGHTMIVPEWRTDVDGIQEVANDILRAMLAEGKENIVFHDVSLCDDYSYYRAIMKKKAYYGNHGFIEVMTRPFIEYRELEEIEVYSDEKYDVIQILNPLNKKKNIIMPSLLTKLKKNLKVNHQIFEVSKVKFKKQGCLAEQDVIGVAGEYVNGDSMYAILHEIYEFSLEEGNRIIVSQKNEKYCIWKLYSGEEVIGTVYIQYDEKKKVTILAETYLMRFKTIKEVRQEHKGMVRELSIDLPIYCPFERLMQRFFNKEYGNIHHIQLSRITLYRKENVWMTNYIVRIFFENIRKKDISEFNCRLMGTVMKLRKDELL